MQKRLPALLLAALLAIWLAPAAFAQQYGYTPTQAVVFTPTGATPLLWLEHGVGVTTVGTAVSGWADSSGTGDANKNTTQGTAGKRPAYNATDAAYNSLPTISFVNASGQYLASGTWAHAATQPLTVVLVGQLDYTSTETFFDDVSSIEKCAAVAVSGPVFYAFGNGVDYGTTIAGQANLLLQPSVLVVVFNGTTSSAVYVNGIPVAQGNGGTGAFTGTAIGAVAGGFDTLNGKIAEFVVLSGAADLGTITAIDRYYGNLFGISIP